MPAQLAPQVLDRHAQHTASCAHCSGAVTAIDRSVAALAAAGIVALCVSVSKVRARVRGCVWA